MNGEYSIPLLNIIIEVILGQVCNKHGRPLPHGMPPTPCESDKANDDWTPYRDWVQFEVTDFLYHQNQMSASDINFVTGLWAASLAPTMTLHHSKMPRICTTLSTLHPLEMFPGRVLL